MGLVFCAWVLLFLTADYADGRGWGLVFCAWVRLFLTADYADGREWGLMFCAWVLLFLTADYADGRGWGLMFCAWVLLFLTADYADGREWGLMFCAWVLLFFLPRTARKARKAYVLFFLGGVRSGKFPDLRKEQKAFTVGWEIFPTNRTQATLKASVTSVRSVVKKQSISSSLHRRKNTFFNKHGIICGRKRHW